MVSMVEQCRQEGWDLVCLSYGAVGPVIIVLGILGCLGNLAVMTAPEFEGVTFYYLRALSISDLLYLLFATGYYVELLFHNSDRHMREEEVIREYYLTHIDHIMCNTFICTSGFLIVLLTIDRSHLTTRDGLRPETIGKLLGCYF